MAFLILEFSMFLHICDNCTLCTGASCCLWTEYEKISPKYQSGGPQLTQAYLGACLCRPIRVNKYHILTCNMDHTHFLWFTSMSENGNSNAVCNWLVKLKLHYITRHPLHLRGL